MGADSIVKIHSLKNGIRVITEPMQGFRSVSFGVFVGVGSVNETKDINGIAHVIEHMLFKGTSTKTAKMIADEITALGGNLDAYTTKEYTCFYTHTLDIHLHKAVTLIADMIQNPLFDEKELKKELCVIAEEIDMYEDDPEALVHEYLQKEIWKPHPLGFLISGEKATVTKFTRKQILEFKEKYYVGSNIVISAAGHFDEDELLKQVELLFNTIPKGQAVEMISMADYQKKQCFIQKSNEQMHLNLAYPCISYTHEDRYLFTIFNNIFGDNPNSRLFEAIRDGLGLTYSIYSYESCYMTAGLFQIYAAMWPDQTLTVLREIRKVINNLKACPITEKDLSLARTQIETELMIACESTQTRMENNGSTLIYNEPLETPDQIIKKIEKITIEDIKRFIDTYIMNVCPSICLVGDVESIDKEQILQELQYFESQS